MSNFIDLTGEQFGRLTVIRRIKNTKRGEPMWLCQCNCGKQKNILGASLRYNITQSCGCLQKEKSTHHGFCGTRIYIAWSHMLQRCNNPNDKEYHNYGGRGIKVCERWRKFENFLEDMGKKPDELTIDRIDNDGNYCPENCRWATLKEQARNRRDTLMFTINDITLCLTDWCKKLNINYDKVKKRLYRGWDIGRALEIKE